MNSLLLALLYILAASPRPAPANAPFDIVYINLARHSARRRHIVRMLSHANCAFSRFNAVDGLELANRNASISDYTCGTTIAPDDPSIRSRINPENAGRAGCHLSHLIVLRAIHASRSHRPVLVLEDDIDLDEFFVEKLRHAIANPPEKWDVILLGAIVKKKSWARPRNHLVPVRYLACLHAYLVNGAPSAATLADAIDTPHCPAAPVDIIIERAFRHDTAFAFYCFSPMIAVQRRDLFPSDISPPPPAPFYAKYLKNLFSPAFLAPLKNSLAKAAASAKSRAEPHPPLAPLLTLLALLPFILP
jgi:GR25 family glycosyltransferase involved in LPS biosynthesis